MNTIVPPGDHDYMLNADSELQPLIYICTVCTDHFLNHASFLRHSCVEQEQSNSLENENKALLSDDPLHTNPNKMLLDINQYSPEIKNTSQAEEESKNEENENKALLSDDPLHTDPNKMLLDTNQYSPEIENTSQAEEESLNTVSPLYSRSEEMNIPSFEISEKQPSSPLQQYKIPSNINLPISDTNYIPENIPSDSPILLHDLSTSIDKKPKRKFFNHNILCSGCGKFFKCNYYLTHHACGIEPCKTPLPHGSLGNPPYTCKCGAVIKHKSSYSRHLRHECKFRKQVPTHEMNNMRITKDLGDPPYTCKNCGIVIKRKFGFSKHLSICGVPCQYTCQLCGKEFKTKLRLKNHIIHNHNVCSLCHSLFDSVSDLEEHQKNEHEQCSLCKIPFLAKADLDKHVEKAHPSV